MAATPEQKRLARLRLLSEEELQQAKQRALRRVRDIEEIEKGRKGCEQGKGS